jgi:hypothetical protein
MHAEDLWTSQTSNFKTGCLLSKGISSRYIKTKNFQNCTVNSRMPRILHAKSLKYQTLTISYCPVTRGKWGRGCQHHFATQTTINSSKPSPRPFFFLKIAVRSCGGECNGAVSIVTWYTYKEGVRQTCTNRPSVKSSVCVNNSSLHCFNTHMRVHATIYVGSVYLAPDPIEGRL